jgi:hypothetical protein
VDQVSGRRHGLAALVLASAASLATSWVDRQSGRAPCPGAAAWDPNRPLFLSFEGEVPAETASFREALHLYDADGVEVPLLVAHDYDRAYLCVAGGLAPDAAYTWDVGPFDAGANELPVPGDFDLAGRWSFRTAAASAYAPAADEADCGALGGESGWADDCDDPDPDADTGDTG